MWQASATSLAARAGDDCFMRGGSEDEQGARPGKATSLTKCRSTGVGGNVSGGEPRMLGGVVATRGCEDCRFTGWEECRWSAKKHLCVAPIDARKGVAASREQRQRHPALSPDRKAHRGSLATAMTTQSSPLDLAKEINYLAPTTIGRHPVFGPRDRTGRFSRHPSRLKRPLIPDFHDRGALDCSTIDSHEGRGALSQAAMHGRFAGRCWCVLNHEIPRTQTRIIRQARRTPQSLYSIARYRGRLLSSSRGAKL